MVNNRLSQPFSCFFMEISEKNCIFARNKIKAHKPYVIYC